MEIPRDIVGYTEYMLNVKLQDHEKELLKTMYDAYHKEEQLDMSKIITAGRGSGKIDWVPFFALCIFRHEDFIKDLDKLESKEGTE